MPIDPRQIIMDGLMQEKHNFIANTLELHLYWTNWSIWHFQTWYPSWSNKMHLQAIHCMWNKMHPLTPLCIHSEKSKLISKHYIWTFPTTKQHKSISCQLTLRFSLTDVLQVGGAWRPGRRGLRVLDSILLLRLIPVSFRARLDATRLLVTHGGIQLLG